MTIYMIKDCAICKEFIKIVNAKKLPYVTIWDRATLKQHDIKSVPTVEIDGKLLRPIESFEWLKTK